MHAVRIIVDYCPSDDKISTNGGSMGASDCQDTEKSTVAENDIMNAVEQVGVTEYVNLCAEYSTADECGKSLGENYATHAGANAKSHDETECDCLECDYGTDDTHLKGEKYVLAAPDGGWGWMVVVGCFSISMLLPMLAPCFGILYSELLIELGASSVLVAWVFNLFMMMWKMTILLVAPIGREIGVRVVSIMGGFIAALAIMATAFAKSVIYLVLCFSVLAGSGSAFAMGSTFPTLALYFNKKRGLANAFLMAGISVGQLVNAPLIRYLQEKYAYSGATLIVGAIILHTCAGAALLQPVKWHLKRVPKSELDPSDVFPVANFSRTDNRRSGLPGIFGRIVSGIIRDLHILKQRRALLIALIGAFSLNSHFNFLAMVPFAMQDAGHSLSWAAWVVSATALANTVSRILVSTMADHPKFPLRAVYMAGVVTIVLSSIGFTFVLKEAWPCHLMVMGVFGCGVGLVMGLHNLAMIHIVGVANIKAMFGVNNVMVGLGFITIGPLTGVVRDVTGSYAASMWVLAGVMSLCALLWCLMPAAVARDLKNATTQSSSSNELRPST